jgi:hypothetical protein
MPIHTSRWKKSYLPDNVRALGVTVSRSLLVADYAAVIGTAHDV